MDRTEARLPRVKEALDWAYRSGYCFAEIAAEELARHLGEELRKESLGVYGDTLEWRRPSPMEVAPVSSAQEPKAPAESRMFGCRQRVCSCHDPAAWEDPNSYPDGCSLCGCRRDKLAAARDLGLLCTAERCAVAASEGTDGECPFCREVLLREGAQP
jgi:hypothetical protein